MYMSRDQSEALTCGRGIAANGELPEQMADVIGAIAQVLEHHMTALPVSDESARAELEGYASVVSRARSAESALRDMAEEMRAKRDLPEAPHDMAVLMAPTAQDLFGSLLLRERALAALLDRRLKEHVVSGVMAFDS
jgi:hypothetical protein